MIEFEKLFVIPCNKGIYIRCSVLSESYYNDVYIDKIIIDDKNTFVSSGPSDNPVYTKTVDDNTKSIEISISSNEILANFENNVFFVYVIAKGTPSADTPCGCDNTTNLGVAADTTEVVRKALNYIGEVNSECSIPKNLINFILLYRAFQLALKTKAYTTALKYWDKLVGNTSTSKTNGCGCHG